MTSILQPADEAELVDVIAEAGSKSLRLAISGGGSKSGMGRAVDAQTLSMTEIAGIVDYDPAELILSVKPGTPLAQVQALVAGERQMLAFDPFDHGPIFGRDAGTATIGGVIAAGVGGSRRVSAGGARDHLLGLRGVSGRGEAFVAGAKVVKNVTGYDLPKLAAGSWGRLFALSELTLKVLPRPETARTLAIEGLDFPSAVRAMAAAMGSQADIAATAHVPAADPNRSAITAFRIEGFGPSVEARSILLQRLLRERGSVAELPQSEAESFWDGLRTLRSLPQDRSLWRINIPPSAACSVIDALRPLDPRWMADWAGGLLWVALEADPAIIRDAALRAGGHAMLMRGTQDVRSATPAFHPQPAALAALEERVRRAFDPLSLFETGRF